MIREEVTGWEVGDSSVGDSRVEDGVGDDVGYSGAGDW